VKRLQYFSATVCLLAFAFGAPVASRAQSEITLLAPGTAASRDPINKIVANFEAKTGHKVKVTYVNGLEARQVVAKGAPLDVSLVVAPFPGALSSGAIISSSATPIASFLTAVGVPKGSPKPDISTPAAVKKAFLAAKSIGYEDPDFTIAGEGPLEAFQKLGIADQVFLKSKVMLGPAATGISPNATANVESTYTQLEKGEIDIGLLSLSDMLRNKDKFEIVGVLPRKICTPTAIVGFISTHASDPAAAKALLQFLAAPESQAILKDAGFEPHS
jgi:molybdate transport system substrate-binding protein